MNRRTSILMAVSSCLFLPAKKTYWNWTDGYDKGGSTGPVMLNGKHVTDPVLWCDSKRGVVCHMKKDKDGEYILDGTDLGEPPLYGIKRFYSYGKVEVLPKNC